jgi:16S rRNA (adenine1518-N6/adenine1519-N6)-dimethyltransferase
VSVPSLAAIRAALAAQGAHPTKRFGQNFLTDPGILQRIVAAAGLRPGEVVLEVGPGPGTLTATLLDAGASVVAVEADAAMAQLLATLVPPRRELDVVLGDALAERPAPAAAVRAALGARGAGPYGYALVANLPYQVATPLLIDVLEDFPPRVAVVTIQREVGERLIAAPGSEAYGPLSVLVRLLARAEIVATLRPGAFWPAPKVESAIVRIVPLVAAERLEAAAHRRVRTLVKGAFAMRRKQLATALAAALGVPREATFAALTARGLPPLARGEELSAADFLALAGVLRFRDAT